MSTRVKELKESINDLRMQIDWIVSVVSLLNAEANQCDLQIMELLKTRATNEAALRDLEAELKDTI
jgi:chorismate mutase